MLQAVRQVQNAPLPSRGEEVIQTLTAMQRAMEHDFQVRLTSEVESVRTKLIERLEDLRQEIDRVNDLLQTVSKEIDTKLNDPNVDLARIMRQKTEQTVLRAYLDGLNYAACIGRELTGPAIKVSSSAG